LQPGQERRQCGISDLITDAQAAHCNRILLALPLTAKE
jgi:hypothetical protein